MNLQCRLDTSFPIVAMMACLTKFYTGFFLIWDPYLPFFKSLSKTTFWRRKWQPTLVFLPRESQGQRSLVGCTLWGHTELDMTEAT